MGQIESERGVIMDECKYCHGNADDRKFLLRETGIYIDEDGRLSDDANCEDEKINYCPMCGRKL